MSLKSLFSFVYKFVNTWLDNDNTRAAAAIAFYTIFSLAPTLVIGVFIGGHIIEENKIKEEIISEVRTFVGNDGAQVVATMLENVTDIKKGALASSLSLILLFYGASHVFTEMRDALNRIFGASNNNAKEIIIGYLRARLVGISLVLIFGFFLVISLILNAFISGFSEWIIKELDIKINILNLLNLFISGIFIWMLFSMLIKLLPDRTIPWRYTLLGSFISTLIFLAVKHIVGIYLGTSIVSSVYGTAGAIVVLLIWVYFTVQILLLGAEICNTQLLYTKTKSIES